jgi:hypothetical protein
VTGATEHGPAFWVAVVLGVAVMAWGGWLLVDATTAGGERVGWGLWVVLADLLVDWLVLPLVAAIGWLTGRWVPPWARPPILVALGVTGVVLALAGPGLASTAAGTGNPTIQPIDETRAVGVTLAALWAAAVAWALVRRRDHD